MASQATLFSLWGKPKAPEGEAKAARKSESKRPAVDPEAPTPAKRQAVSSNDDVLDLTGEPEKEGAPSPLLKTPKPKPLQLKQAAAAPAKPSGAAKAKKGAGKGPKEAYRKVSQHGVKGAAYFDECIGWAKLSDGREIVLGREAWHVPAGFAGHPNKEPPVQVGEMPERASHFAPLPNLDLFAALRGSFRETSRVTLHSLPSCEEVASIQMPPGCDLRHIATAGTFILAVGDSRLLLIAASAPPGGAPPSLSLALDVNLESAGQLTQLLGPKPQSFYPRRIACASLFIDANDKPHAVLGRGTSGVALVVPLGGASPGDVRVARELQMHQPMRRSDKEGWVGGMALWHRGGGGVSLVTVGSDGMCSVAALQDGKEMMEGSWPDDSWHCTSRGSGGSKGYPYGHAHTVAVHSASGVAFTGGQCEAVGHLWDLESGKSSPEGKRLCKTPKFATGGASKVLLMTAGFSESGLLACSNSNNDEDDTLKVLRPAGGK